MNIFGHQISSKDFIPPIWHRLFRLAGVADAYPPFDALPENIQAKWILDVGANAGHVALAGLKTYPDSRVICFEPVSATFDMLRQNLAAYGDRVILFNQALSDTNGSSEINVTSFHGANSLEPQSALHKNFNPHVREVGTEKIALVRLDDVAAEFPTGHIDILKIDVEGHELSVLKGGARFIAAQVDAIIIEVSLMRDNSTDHQAVFEIFALLNSWGFRLINIFDLHHVPDADLMLVQMDCVFRKNKSNGHEV
ncbi:MAG: FkbM family methyltransferase [Pseudomonadota bacterium]